MKCLALGTRTNEEKTVFKSWSRSSKLKGLARSDDFPFEKKESSIIMSCDYATVKKGDNQIMFPECPKMKIKDGCSPLYSEYITENLPSVAYHDEPRFLKMQELIKLILAVEWLYKEKGVRASEKWMMKHTSSKPVGGLDLDDTRKMPPKRMIPQPPVFKPPSDDVTVKIWEIERCRTVAKRLTEERYGYYDSSTETMITFREDGMLCPPQKGIEFHSPEIEAQFVTTDMLLELLPKNLHHEITAATAMVVDAHTGERRITTKSCPSLSLTLQKVSTIVAATASELFTNQDPINPLMEADIFETIHPDVESFISEATVPIPYLWLTSSHEIGQPAAWGGVAWGGVSTRDIKVVEEPLKMKAAHRETPWIDNFKKSGQHLLGIRADKVIFQGMSAAIHLDYKGSPFFVSGNVQLVSIGDKFSGQTPLPLEFTTETAQEMESERQVK